MSTSAESVHNIPAPYNTPAQADLVIETSDGAHLYVVKTFLVYASPFFSNLFSDSTPTEEYKGIPLYRVPETCRTMVTLLQLCYPAYLINLDILGAHIDRALIDAMEKYVMEDVFNHLKAIMEKEEMGKENPLRIYAIARHLRWDDLTRVAARECLNVDFLGAEAIPELEMITLLDYQTLGRYFRECSSAVIAFLTRALRSRQFRVVAPLPDTLSKYTCTCSSGKRDCIWVAELKIHPWFRNYICKTVIEEAAVRPGRCIVRHSTLAQDDAVLYHAYTDRDLCGAMHNMNPRPVMQLLDYLQGEVDTLISEACCSARLHEPKLTVP